MLFTLSGRGLEFSDPISFFWTLPAQLALGKTKAKRLDPSVGRNQVYVQCGYHAGKESSHLTWHQPYIPCSEHGRRDPSGKKGNQQQRLMFIRRSTDHAQKPSTTDKTSENVCLSELRYTASTERHPKGYPTKNDAFQQLPPNSAARGAVSARKRRQVWPSACRLAWMFWVHTRQVVPWKSMPCPRAPEGGGLELLVQCFWVRNEVLQIGILKKGHV